jgi:Na+-translocating ferredoxin:NAD+ oxidoreductase RnfD subunit
MKITDTIATLYLYPRRNPRLRLFALWYFTVLITAWTVAGHTFLGFEQAWAAPVVGVATAILVQVLLEWVDARARGRKPRFTGGVTAFVHFLPAAIIPGLACAMLIYPNERLMPIVFAAALSIGSKVLFRAPLGNGTTQHIFNPSNLGITATLLLFPWVGLAPPYHFTQNITGVGHWILPGVILITGIIIHALFTGRLPLVLAWLGAFVLQGVLRAWYANNAWYVPLMPMTSAAFILFTLYMIPDPATTPLRPWRQVVFGVAVAAAYGLLQVLHVVFGLFIALAAVCAVRGIGLYLLAALRSVKVPAAEAARKEPVVAAGAVAG